METQLTVPRGWGEGGDRGKAGLGKVSTGHPRGGPVLHIDCCHGQADLYT